MRVLGPAIIDCCQQRDMERGKQELLIGIDRVFADAASRAVVGDVWWVKEPYCEVKSRQFGPQNIHEMIPGSPIGMTIPAHLKPFFHILHCVQRPAVGLNRGDSRACLRIAEITDRGFRCEVIMDNVNAHLAKAVAA